MVGIVIERRSKQVRRICHCCGQRKARFQYHGHVRADRHHNLCFRCFRAEGNRQRVIHLARIRRPMMPAFQVAGGALGTDQRA